MKQRVEEMEREANKLRELQAAAAQSTNADGGESEGGEAMETDEDKSLSDGRSVFVGNVSWSSGTAIRGSLTILSCSY